MGSEPKVRSLRVEFFSPFFSSVSFRRRT